MEDVRGPAPAVQVVCRGIAGGLGSAVSRKAGFVDKELIRKGEGVRGVPRRRCLPPPFFQEGKDNVDAYVDILRTALMWLGSKSFIFQVRSFQRRRKSAHVILGCVCTPGM